MKENIETVRQFYNQDAEKEWDRLGSRHPVEFILTTWMMDKYIRPGDSILAGRDATASITRKKAAPSRWWTWRRRTPPSPAGRRRRPGCRWSPVPPTAWSWTGWT